MEITDLSPKLEKVLYRCEGKIIDNIFSISYKVVFTQYRIEKETLKGFWVNISYEKNRFVRKEGKKNLQL